MKRNFWLFLCIAVIFILINNSVVFADDYYSNATDKMIDKLFDERAKLVLLGKHEEAMEIDKELSKYGVDEIKSVNYFAKNNLSDYMPFIEVPDWDNVKWYSRKSTIRRIINSKVRKFEVQTLIAQPVAGKDSNLILKGYRGIKTNKATKLWDLKFITVVAQNGISQLPVYGAVVSLYDILKNVIEIKNPEVNIDYVEVMYSYASVTTASFKFVKEKGTSQEYLTFISTKNMTEVGYQIPTVAYKNKTLYPKIIQGVRFMDAKPKHYDSNIIAVDAYLSHGNKIKTDYVTSIQISGLESRMISKLYPVCPRGIGDIY